MTEHHLVRDQTVWTDVLARLEKLIRRLSPAGREAITVPSSDGYANRDTRLAVVRRYQTDRRHKTRTNAQLRNIAFWLKIKYFPQMKRPQIMAALSGKSILDAVVSLYCADGGQSMRHLEPGRRHGRPEPSRSPDSHGRRTFTRTDEDEVEAALWYCFFAIAFDLDVLGLCPRLSEQTSREAQPFTGQCPICVEDMTEATTAQCSADMPHRLCKTCLGRIVTDEVLERKKHSFRCVAGPGCEAVYDRRQYDHVGGRVLSEIDRLDQEAQVRAAGLDGLKKCRFCNFAMIYEPGPDINTFWCLAEGCRKTSCLFCDGPSHQGTSCHEAMMAQIQSGDDGRGRKLVEEAMSLAVKRCCRDCNAPFVRQDGCNKMVCMSDECNSGYLPPKQCYACHEAILGYSHFKSWPEDDGPECPLFDGGIDREAVERSAAREECLRFLRDDLHVPQHRVAAIEESLEVVEETEYEQAMDFEIFRIRTIATERVQAYLRNQA